MRPVDLAREHGLAAQTVRNHEADGVLPPAARTPSGYRVYTTVHAAALRAYLAAVRAHGYPAARGILRAVAAGDLATALRLVDATHVRLARDRETLRTVEAALSGAGEPPVIPGPPLTVGELAHRLGVSPATLRTWERAGVLRPARDLSGRRVYTPADIRDADLAHLLRRGGHLLGAIAAVTEQVRAAGGTVELAALLAEWRSGLDARGRALLTAAARLDEYLEAASAG